MYFKIKKVSKYKKVLVSFPLITISVILENSLYFDIF